MCNTLACFRELHLAKIPFAYDLVDMSVNCCLPAFASPCRHMHVIAHQHSYTRTCALLSRYPVRFGLDGDQNRELQWLTINTKYTFGVYNRRIFLVANGHRRANGNGSKKGIGRLYTRQQLQHRTTRDSDRCTLAPHTSGRQRVRMRCGACRPQQQCLCSARSARG